jgi:chorismate mutase/prephenate dehydratase
MARSLNTQGAEPSASAARPAAPTSELAKLRARIDAVDDAILAQLNERARIVLEVGRLKQGAGILPFDGARERGILERLAALNPGPFPTASIPQVFREIVGVMRSLEGPLRVAYLGPEGTFSHLAARQQFGGGAEFVAEPTLADVIAAVTRGRADLAVVPVENTTEGVVTPTLDAFVEADVPICGEVVLRIAHHLLSRSGKLADVKRVASIPQALAQCRLWLDAHLPGVDRVETASTAAAARLAGSDASVAAIGSALAGEAWSLATIQSSIEDRRDNTTRFVVLGRAPSPPSGNDLTSAIFTVRRDESGALHRLLAPFSAHGVNLTSIQSRPLKGKPWEYVFFVDLEGHRDEPRVAQALAEAGAMATAHRVLGSFPRALPRAGSAGGA